VHLSVAALPVVVSLIFASLPSAQAMADGALLSQIETDLELLSSPATAPPASTAAPSAAAAAAVDSLKALLGADDPALPMAMPYAAPPLRSSAVTPQLSGVSVAASAAPAMHERHSHHHSHHSHLKSTPAETKRAPSALHPSLRRSTELPLFARYRLPPAFTDTFCSFLGAGEWKKLNALSSAHHVAVQGHSEAVALTLQTHRIRKPKRLLRAFYAYMPTRIVPLASLLLVLLSTLLMYAAHFSSSLARGSFSAEREGAGEGVESEGEAAVGGSAIAWSAATTGANVHHAVVSLHTCWPLVVAFWLHVISFALLFPLLATRHVREREHLQYRGLHACSWFRCGTGTNSRAEPAEGAELSAPLDATARSSSTAEVARAGGRPSFFEFYSRRLSAVSIAPFYKFLFCDLWYALPPSYLRTAVAAAAPSLPGTLGPDNVWSSTCHWSMRLCLLLFKLWPPVYYAYGLDTVWSNGGVLQYPAVACVGFGMAWCVLVFAWCACSGWARSSHVLLQAEADADADAGVVEHGRPSKPAPSHPHPHPPPSLHRTISFSAPASSSAPLSQLIMTLRSVEGRRLWYDQWARFCRDWALSFSLLLASWLWPAQWSGSMVGGANTLYAAALVHAILRAPSHRPLRGFWLWTLIDVGMVLSLLLRSHWPAAILLWTVACGALHPPLFASFQR
jgi:hypothetical protein